MTSADPSSEAKQKRDMPSPVALWLVSWIVPAWLWVVKLTTRWTHIDRSNYDNVVKAGQPFILTFWHGRIMMTPFVRLGTGRDFVMLASDHKDGQYIAAALKRFGLDYARGSKANPRKREKQKGGATALKSLINAIKGGANVGITPDGPRGPRQRVTMGTLQLARLSGAPIVPVAWSTKRGRHAKSWDRFLIAAPFSKGYYVYGDPVYVTAKAPDDLEKLRVEIEQALNDITLKADILAGRTPIEPEPQSEPLQPRQN